MPRGESGRNKLQEQQQATVDGMSIQEAKARLAELERQRASFQATADNMELSKSVRGDARSNVGKLKQQIRLLKRKVGRLLL